MKKIWLSLVLIIFFLPGLISPRPAEARDNISDWYIKEFESIITVNQDSTALITEKIVADCGDLPNKHGIFRVLPTELKTTEGNIKTPIELVSITDFSGEPYNYSTSHDLFNNTVSWKIGDADVTVSGENEYQITYKVANVIRPDNPNFDEFYWDILGAYWQLEIDDYEAQIRFPEEITMTNSEVWLYGGTEGSNESTLGEYRWVYDHTIEVTESNTVYPGQGITMSVAMPKDIFTPYEFSWLELYWTRLFLIIPGLTFVLCFWLWRKYGDDPDLDKTVIARYDIPQDLSPMAMGVLLKNGGFNNKFITASIINLATNGFLIIEKVEKPWLIEFFSGKDFRLNRTDKVPEKLPEEEQLLLARLFNGKQTILMSDLKNSFYKDIPDIKKAAKENLTDSELIETTGSNLKIVFLVLAAIVFVGVFPGILVPWISISLFMTSLILVVFAFFMPKRTVKGTQLVNDVKGFKLYLEVAEKDRQRFYEQENLFEKFLPYAVMFGMTKLWLKKMEQIYGEDYYRNYAPAWYTAHSLQSFSVSSFTSQLNSLSSSISSNVSAPSGSGGGGSVGGGGGGGGGGGW